MINYGVVVLYHGILYYMLLYYITYKCTLFAESGVVFCVVSCARPVFGKRGSANAACVRQTLVFSLCSVKAVRQTPIGLCSACVRQVGSSRPGNCNKSFIRRQSL